MNKFLILSLIFYETIFYSYCTEVLMKDDIELNGFSITDYSASFGYPCEVHKNIVTKDGYLLDLHRIPYGRNSTTRNNRTPILLMHGLGGSAENFIITGPEHGLAYLFADRGYDVWVGNSRGSPHSKRHTKLDSKTAAFWDFSWHEIGVFDLPAKIDYILQTTRREKMLYLGHSQGTTSFYVLMADKPEYNKKIELMLSLAPAAFEGKPPYMPEPLLSINMKALETFRAVAGTGEIGSHSRDLICHDKLSPKEFCTFMVIMMSVGVGLNLEQVNVTAFQTIQQGFGFPIALRQVLHYHQSSCSGGFNHYDFGTTKNLAVYKAASPPSYDLKKVVAPVALFYGKSDKLATPPNVERLSTVLPNVVLKYLIPYEGFTHLDFVFAKDINELLYNKMFEFIDGFRKTKAP